MAKEMKLAFTLNIPRWLLIEVDLDCCHVLMLL
jgi:hypothetical protein